MKNPIVAGMVVVLGFGARVGATLRRRHVRQRLIR